MDFSESLQKHLDYVKIVEGDLKETSDQIKAIGAALISAGFSPYRHSSLQECILAYKGQVFMSTMTVEDKQYRLRDDLEIGDICAADGSGMLYRIEPDTNRAKLIEWFVATEPLKRRSMVQTKGRAVFMVVR
jgi:hypothetical protein